MIDSALEVLGIVLLLLGLVGIVLPLLPGILLSWVGFFLYAQASHFEQISFGATIDFSRIIFGDYFSRLCFTFNRRQKI